MRTIYIYLSVTGWIWFVIAGSYLLMKLKARRSITERSSIADTSDRGAKQPNEQ